MDRYTRKDAIAAFVRLIKAIGGRVATDYNDVGAYRLDWNPTYGGGNIERIYNTRGGVTRPFGARRLNAKEFCLACQFTLDVLAEAQGRMPEGI